MSEWQATEIGLIPTDWKLKTLNQYVQKGRGICYGVVQPGFHDEDGISIIRVNNLRDGRIISDDVLKISTDIESQYSRSRLQGGEILISLVGNVGEIAIVDSQYEGWNVARAVGVVPVDENIDKEWLKYWLQSPQVKHFISTHCNTTVQITLNLKDVSDLPILEPTLKEQKLISSIPSALDRKIENLRRQNETLEAIAQTLFKHWFVDFEFPNEDGKPYKSSGGEMKRSELGEIPADWNTTKLSNFCDIKHGYAFKGEFITTEETDQVLLTPGNFRIGGGFNSSKYKYYSDIDYDEEYVLAPGDLIVTMTDLSKEGDTLGYPAFVPKSSRNIFLHNQRLGKVINSQIDSSFLFFLLCRREYRSHILGTASGSTVRHTSPSRILEYEFAVPARTLLDRFSLIASNLICKTFSNHAQIETLARIRDELLPQLMSGKLCVTE